jgi:hypothetical protein
MSRRDTTKFDTVNATVSEPHTAEMGAFQPLFFSRIKPCLYAMANHIARQRRAKKKHGITRLFAD